MESKVQTCYTTGVETLLTIRYAELGRKPKVDFNIGEVGMLSVDTLLAMATRDMLINLQGIIPADIMNFFFSIHKENVAMMQL